MKPHAINLLNRRHFIKLSTLSAAGLLCGCASNPVTGESQLMLVSEKEEIQIDRIYSPQQISADYGVTQDARLAAYIQAVGAKMASLTHRPKMPYRFFLVNATYVNAYAFPGGTIACTRGILLKLENEGELAALIGHELGHVNARHTAEIMSKNKLTSAIVGGIGAAVGAYDAGYGNVAAQLGMLGSGALLASYSRDNERQADDLGLKYMVEAGYNPDGMVGLMDMLQNMSRHKAGAAELLFATHPMSDERYKTAVKNVRKKYQDAAKKPLFRERYMDSIAALRKIEKGIDLMQQGDALMAAKKYAEAESRFTQALKIATDDYTGLIKLSESQLMQEKFAEADRSSQQAKKAYPREAQAYFISGFVRLNRKAYAPAYDDFDHYDKQLPGNPSILFYKGLSLEYQGQKKRAADHYKNYLQVVREGNNADYAYARLVEWGYLKKN